MLSSPRDLGSQRGDAAPSCNKQLLKPLRLLTKATVPVTVRQPEGRDASQRGRLTKPTLLHF